jgi:Patatin-like phospholipase
MMSSETGAPARTPRQYSEPVSFETVFRTELELINERRSWKKIERGEPPPGALGTFSVTGVFSDKEPVLNAIGLSLSGGGIRSASFCLGALQALDKVGVLKHVDYLSTVSGGGYIGSSLSAGMSTYDGRFPFESKLDQDETPAVKHIRNYSNYLIPHGKIDLLESLVIYLRGLVANVILVLPWIIFAAYITVRSNPTREYLNRPDILGIQIPNIFPYGHFVLATYLALMLLVLFAGWTLVRSLKSQSEREVPSPWTAGYSVLLTGLFVLAFFELQPFIFSKIWQGSDSTYAITSWLQRVSVVLAPFAGAIAFFNKYLEGFIKRATESPSKTSKAAAYTSKALLYIAAAVLPLLLWAVYLELAWWGIADCATSPCQYPDAPRWLVAAADGLFGRNALLWSRQYPMANFYMLCFLVLVAASMLLKPNANSLHRLYRDRLSKAFLFKPQEPHNRSKLEAQSTPKDLDALDGFKLTSLDPKLAPYHLLNTALNIQGSRVVNRRGRNADFFTFSREYVGSEATGYARTKDLEDILPELDLGTAMAVSAAAASPNMGRATVRPLTPTLALLNVRVGFWLRNPKFVRVARWKRVIREFFSLYFLYELIANLRETSWNVYVTDGGHLENLGVYELLRRRCRVIVAIDAEADPEMRFASFVTLQRYARIDLGVRIEMPWQNIRETSLKTSRRLAETGATERLKGPHCAIGHITYPDDGKGVLVYVKSSTTGDENDYILDYKNRYPLFPHESTGDQFFSEEQFEVYRALGFHAAFGLFTKRDGFTYADPSVIEFLGRVFGASAGETGLSAGETGAT